MRPEVRRGTREERSRRRPFFFHRLFATRRVIALFQEGERETVAIQRTFVATSLFLLMRSHVPRQEERVEEESRSDETAN